jgi:hypothetical protein
VNSGRLTLIIQTIITRYLTSMPTETFRHKTPDNSIICQSQILTTSNNNLNTKNNNPIHRNHPFPTTAYLILLITTSRPPNKDKYTQPGQKVTLTAAVSPKLHTSLFLFHIWIPPILQLIVITFSRNRCITISLWFIL